MRSALGRERAMQQRFHDALLGRDDAGTLL